MVDTTTDQDKMDQIGNRSVMSNSSSPSQSQTPAEYLKSLLQLGGVVQKPLVSQEQRQGDMRFNTSLPAHPDENLMEPQLAAHNIDQRFVCDVCGIVLTHKKHLVRHLLIHRDTQCRFICNVCGVGLKRKEDLDRHLLSHRDERPYRFICNVCGVDLKRKDHLDRHLLSHRDERPYRFICNVCGVGCKRKEHLDRHLLSHKDELPCRFICNVCGVGLKRKEHLDRHLLSHKDVRPYSCGECNMKFKRSEHLSRHSLYHCSRKAQKMASTSNIDVRTVEVITIDSDDEDQPDSFNLKPVPDKPKNTCNNSDSDVVPKLSDVSASPSLPSVTELNVQGPKSCQYDSILPTNLSEAEDTESEIQTEFVTCDDYDQFVHCDKGASSCVQCYNLLIGEASAPDIDVMVDPMTKTDPDEIERKDIWSERPAPDIKFMVDPMTKTDPDEIERKDIWSERPAPDIKFMVDPMTKTDPDEMDQKGNFSVVSNSSLSPDVKDTDYLSSIFQLVEEVQMPHKSRKQREGDVKFISFPDGTRFYFCPKCQAAYPNKNLLKHHLVAHFERRYICNVCGAGMKRKEHLDRHLVSHSNERPYRCGVCSKTFKRPEHVSRHSRVIHFSRKPQKKTRASKKEDKTVELNITDSVGEDQHSPNFKPVPDKPKKKSDNNVIPKESDVTAKSSLFSATELNEQSQMSYQCDSVLPTNLLEAVDTENEITQTEFVTSYNTLEAVDTENEITQTEFVTSYNTLEAVDTENEITQTEFVTSYNRVFDDHVANLCKKMGDLIFLSVKEEESYEQRLIATDKITCEQLREKEKQILKMNFLQVHDKYNTSFATMFHDVVAVVLANAPTIKLQRILLLSWFLKLFIRITADLLPEHSDSPTSIWKKIIDLLSNYKNPSPMVEEIFALNEVDFEKECWKTLDLIQKSFC